MINCRALVAAFAALCISINTPTLGSPGMGGSFFPTKTTEANLSTINKALQVVPPIKESDFNEVAQILLGAGKPKPVTSPCDKCSALLSRMGRGANVYCDGMTARFYCPVVGECGGMAYVEFYRKGFLRAYIVSVLPMPMTQPSSGHDDVRQNPIGIDQGTGSGGITIDRPEDWTMDKFYEIANQQLKDIRAHKLSGEAARKRLVDLNQHEIRTYIDNDKEEGGFPAGLQPPKAVYEVVRDILKKSYPTIMQPDDMREPSSDTFWQMMNLAQYYFVHGLSAEYATIEEWGIDHMVKHEPLGYRPGEEMSTYLDRARRLHDDSLQLRACNFISKTIHKYKLNIQSTDPSVAAEFSALAKVCEDQLKLAHPPSAH